MSERLTFNYGTSGHRGEAPVAPGRQSEPARQELVRPETGAVRTAVVPPERRELAFTGLLAFTALLFFRPQDQIPALNPLHLAEIAALFALAAMVFGRVRRGLSITRVTPELAAVVGLGGLILATAPFSIWMGGSVRTFTEVYVKIILIFILMVNTLTTPKRIDRFLWLIVLVSGYIAMRAVADYLRGTNLVENGRVQGAVGGMFKNPNDLALNMVAVMPFAALFAMRSIGAVRRLVAALAGVFMMGAVIASQSRSGTIGLAMMILVLGAYMARRRPAIVLAGVFAFVLALPLLPSSYWNRVSSITDQSRDETGSREARRILLKESFTAFLEHPITGVGAGQFKNYNPEGRQEAWRESHNVILQVAAELGIGGLGLLLFLIGRAALAGRYIRRLLRRASPRAPGGGAAPAVITAEERSWVELYISAATAAMVGWLFCALFASVAYNWTFYYLLALAIAPREFLLQRLAATKPQQTAAIAPSMQVHAAHV
jgi:putative inorganic carbon (hco3(-)) transporter